MFLNGSINSVMTGSCIELGDSEVIYFAIFSRKHFNFTDYTNFGLYLIQSHLAKAPKRRLFRSKVWNFAINYQRNACGLLRNRHKKIELSDFFIIVSSYVTGHVNEPLSSPHSHLLHSNFPYSFAFPEDQYASWGALKDRMWLTDRQREGGASFLWAAQSPSAPHCATIQQS